MKIIKKYPGEAENFTFDFTNKVVTGEMVTTVVSVTAIDAVTKLTTSDLTFGTPSIASPLVTVRVSGGGTGKIYVLTCLVTTNLNPAETLAVQGGISVNDPAG